VVVLDRPDNTGAGRLRRAGARLGVVNEDSRYRLTDVADGGRGARSPLGSRHDTGTARCTGANQSHYHAAT